MIGCHPFQPADRDGLLIDSPAAACRLTGPVADAAEYAREHVRLAILDIGVAESPLRNEPYIKRYIGMGRAGPLAIDHFVEVVGV
jgi:hypothetical protein